MILACQNISKAFGDKQILKDITFHIEEKEKIAIVGINGSGKTTLLKIIMGEEQPDSGQVVISKQTTIGYLSQHQDILFDNTIYGEMLDTKKDIIETEKRLRELETAMKGLAGDELDNALDEYNRLQSKYDRENGYACQSEITGVLKGLGFDREDYDRHINTLSGGQKMRIALGKLLLTRPDIVILDEPTNHLDMTSTAWLENFLAGYDGSVIIVSHDRYFIDKIATKIIEIDNCRSMVYNGGYSLYAAQRAKIRADRLKAYLNQQQEIKHSEEVIAKLKQFNREKSIKRAESREKMLEKTERLEKPAETASEMRLTLTPSVESGNDVLTIRGLTKSFGDNLLFSELDMDIKRGEHVSLIGANGTGKTTILKIINRLVGRDGGTVTLGSRVRIGYYDQEHHVLSMHKTIFEEISDAYPELTNTRIRNILAAFLFTGDDVFKKIEDLSGGERGRVSLAKLMLSPANFLILDEPTNHLDIQSKEILENTIKNYEETVLVVSHDRYFINVISTRIIELKNGRLYSFIGNYDYYDTHKEQIYKAATPNNVAGISDNSESKISSSKQDYINSKEEQARQRKQKNDIKKIEQKISELEDKISAIDERINAPENATNAALLGELSEERETLDNELIELYEKYYELT